MRFSKGRPPSRRRTWLRFRFRFRFRPFCLAAYRTHSQDAAKLPRSPRHVKHTGFSTSHTCKTTAEGSRACDIEAASHQLAADKLRLAEAITGAAGRCGTDHASANIGLCQQFCAFARGEVIATS